MHALRPGGVDEDLEHRPREGKVGDAGGIELEGEVRLRFAVLAGLEVVRPQHRPDHAQERAQDPVLVEARDAVEAVLDLGDHRVHLGVERRVAGRLEAKPEELDETAREFRVGGQRLLHIGLAEGAAGLPQVFRDRP